MPGSVLTGESISSLTLSASPWIGWKAKICSISSSMIMRMSSFSGSKSSPASWNIGCDAMKVVLVSLPSKTAVSGLMVGLAMLAKSVTLLVGRMLMEGGALLLLKVGSSASFGCGNFS